ncbi:membrane protein [Thioalkalivibrio paradoxus ARh 1]|uniref:Membrane protein n=1 Tax=Thioalkalivibrio paradoxus ARh 1 TaxID=713585 RepID=W0DJS4_9GAMM|nr:membrane protein [Thioalkalivibrio paradoxus ARh 1]
MPLWFKSAYLAFVAVLVPAYTVEHGLVNFLWLSNVALLGGLLAAWFESPRLASMLLVAVLLPELAWILDFLASLVLLGRSLFGVVEYMYNPEIALFVRLLSLYHLLLPFVLLWLVWRLGYDRGAWKLWIPIGLSILLLSFLLSSPERNVNWVWGPGGEPQEWMSPQAWLIAVMLFCSALWWVTQMLLGHVLRRVAGPVPPRMR